MAVKIAIYSNPPQIYFIKIYNPHKFLSQESANPHKSYSSLNDSVISLRQMRQAGMTVPSRTMTNI